MRPTEWLGTSLTVSALEGSKPSCYEGTMHDLLGMEGPDFCLVELVLRDMLHVRAALANSASA